MAANKFTIIPEELFRTLSPIFHLSRFFCLQPLRWKQMNRNYVITKSKTYLIYSIATVLTLVLTSIFTLAVLLHDEVLYNIRVANRMQSYITYCDVGVVLVPSVVGVLITSLKIDRHIDYIEVLNRTDRLLLKHPTKYCKQFFVAVVTVVYSSALLIFDLITFVRIFYKHRNLFIVILLYLPFYTCYYFTLIMELVYWHLVYSIKIRLRVMNECLLKTSDSEEIFQVIDKKNCQKLVSTVMTPTSGKLHRVRDLFKVYDYLREATNHVNDCYGLIMLFVLLGCYVHLLATPYNMYTELSNTGDVIFAVSHAIWMCAHILRLIFVIEPCHNCLDEVNNTSAIICKLLAGDLSGEIKEFLQIFASYLDKCKIEFTVLGLAKLNRNLLTSIAGTVSTYLVIILQFYKQL